MRARPSGTARIRPGSSSSFSCCRISPAIASSMSASPISSTRTTWRLGRATRGPSAGSSRGRTASASPRFAPMSTRESNACSPTPTMRNWPRWCASSRSASITSSSIRSSFSPTSCTPSRKIRWRPATRPIGVRRLCHPRRADLSRCPPASTVSALRAKAIVSTTRPAHRVLLQPACIGRGLVTNAQWLEFMAEGGYATPSLWLSDGWATVEAEGWNAPGYWRKRDGAWYSLTLGGLRPVDPDAAVEHVSYYEADAFARWAGKHLPTEAEWEVAARANLLDDAFAVVWQWTRSAYLPYPGYRAADGALGEYNGKFMVNQMVLRGSSQATPDGHARASYRNFFHPPARWQFSGVRLLDYV